MGVGWGGWGWGAGGPARPGLRPRRLQSSAPGLGGGLDPIFRRRSNNGSDPDFRAAALTRAEVKALTAA